jgi:hypothetical protein
MTTLGFALLALLLASAALRILAQAMATFAIERRVNQRTARAGEITLPPSVLVQVPEVVR